MEGLHNAFLEWTCFAAGFHNKVDQELFEEAEQHGIDVVKTFMAGWEFHLLCEVLSRTSQTR